MKKILSRGPEFSIAIYEGTSPFHLAPAAHIPCPVLTAADITDVRAGFVADPFMVQENGTWYMFFEVWQQYVQRANIALATSHDGFHWHYQQVVLDEPFHLSYPYVFKYDGVYYMVPESEEAHAVRLYEAVNFPTCWRHCATLLDKPGCVDATPFFSGGYWWMFVLQEPRGAHILRLYLADTLQGPWREHPSSPLIEGDAHIARPAGRVLQFDNRLFRLAQDCKPTYGNKVHVFEITTLTPDAYAEQMIRESPLLKASGTGWNARGMHHVDLQQLDSNRWIACVDGLRKRLAVMGWKL